MSGYRLRKGERLKRATDFSRVFAEGRSGRCRGVVVVALKTGAPSRVGFTAGKRVGSAVDRNRAKRLLREVYRLNADKLAEGYDVVVVARPEILKQPFHEVERAFIKAAKRAGLAAEGCD